MAAQQNILSGRAIENSSYSNKDPNKLLAH